MPRGFALILLVCCLCSPVVASDLTFVDAASKPALTLNFDGSRHVDICHGQKQQEQKQETTSQSDVTFEKSDDSTPALILVGAGILAAAAGVAAQWKNISKTVTAVH